MNKGLSKRLHKRELFSFSWLECFMEMFSRLSVIQVSQHKSRLTCISLFAVGIF